MGPCSYRRSVLSAQNVEMYQSSAGPGGGSSVYHLGGSRPFSSAASTENPSLW